MENPAIWAVIESNKGTVAAAFRRTGTLSVEMEEIAWLHGTVQYHNGPFETHADEDESFVDLAEDYLENPKKSVQEFAAHVRS